VSDVAEYQSEIPASATRRSGARRYEARRAWRRMQLRSTQKKRARPLVVPSGTASLKRTIQRDYTLFGPTVDRLHQPVGLSDGAGNSVMATSRIVMQCL